ncbi:N-acylneuraminate-9-phosphatase [Musca vetustissima]|uniref:N-acylneuraminate-9-phosphatase n=1 Tax=Musca vetustissima TaxID=27455 RepID=UPI002AB6C65A|nr:N-acylneuraminate-9-phosphatase [Musca vetustissima]
MAATNQLLTNASSNDSSSIHCDELSEIKAIFFDLDNTLIPTRSGDSKACREVSEILQRQYGFTKEEANYSTQNFLKSFRRCPDNCQTSLDIWRTHLWHEALPPKYKQLANTIYPIWLTLRYRYLAIPQEYVHLLQNLRKHYMLALITNGPSNAQWEKVRQLDVQQYFDCLLVSGDLPWEKPNPNIFYATCKYLNVQPKQCCMVGDKLESDIKGGNLAGLGATFWLPLTLDEIEKLLHNANDEHKPTYILRNLLEFCDYFNVMTQEQQRREHDDDELLLQQQQQVPEYNNKKCQSKNIVYCRGRSSSPTNNTMTTTATPPIEFSASESDNSSDSI